LWCVDSGCSKHMTGNLKLLINFIWKFLGTVRFENDHVAAILGQFYDSDLEVAFRRNACFVRNLEGVDLLKRDRSTNLYTINLHEMASASQSISWLELLPLRYSLPKFKYHKEHLCPSCEQGKSKRASHPPKPIPNSRQRLHLLHMDLCGPMRIASINGKRKKQTSISSTKASSKFKAEITSSSYGFVWTNENCQYKWEATYFGELDLLFEAMYDDYFGGQPSATVENVSPAQEPQVR
nr:hypothetical protein [Tanacetum cinerariifolium]